MEKRWGNLSRENHCETLSRFLHDPCFIREDSHSDQAEFQAARESRQHFLSCLLLESRQRLLSAAANCPSQTCFIYANCYGFVCVCFGFAFYVCLLPLAISPLAAVFDSYLLSHAAATNKREVRHGDRASAVKMK